MRLRNFSLVLALGLGLAAPMLGRPGPAAVANDEVWQEGYIILTDGTRLDGEIKVGQTKVSYRKKGATVSRDYDFTEIANDKDNKKEIHPVEAGDKAGGKSKLVEIVTTGGNTYRGMGQEQPNGDWKIKVGGKELLVKKNEIKEVRDIEDDSAADPDRYVDFDCRFILERPAKDWKIHHGTSPTVRAQAAFNNGKDESGFVRVSVRPFPQAASSLYDMAHADAAKLKTEVEAELKKEFEKVAAVEVVVAELFGCPVYEVRYEGNYASEATFKCVELRFVRENLLYAITGGCDKTIWKPPLEQKLRDAFASFSWLAAIGGDEDTYTDTALGFAIDRPSAKWTIIGRPFSGESPVTIKKQDDAGEIKVTIERSIRPADLVTRLWNDAAKKTLENNTQKESTKNGITVTAYHHECFGADQAKHDYQGVIAAIGQYVIHAQGDAPVTDARAKEIQDEIRTVLDHMRFVDPTKTAERLSKNAAAALEMNAAYDAYKAKKLEDALAGFRKALVAFDNYARAWFLLGLTYAEKKDWKESANALTRAAELDSQYAGKMGEIAWQQALEDWHAKPPRFEDANKLMKGVLAIDSKNIPAPKRDDYKKMVADWWADTKKDDAKKKDLNKNVRDLVSKCFRGDPEINKTLADVYCDAGETLLGADKKNHNTAHQLAGLADELDKASKRPDELKKKCKDAEKSLVPHK